MPVRDATPADVAEIHAMIRELAEFEQAPAEAVATTDDLQRHLFGPDHVASALVAETDGGDVAGMAVFFRTFSTWRGDDGIWLEDLYVRPPFRHNGFGEALLRSLRERTTGRIEWTVLDWNEGAITFYDGLGAEPVPGWTRYRWLHRP